MNAQFGMNNGRSSQCQCMWTIQHGTFAKDRPSFICHSSIATFHDTHTTTVCQSIDGNIVNFTHGTTGETQITGDVQNRFWIIKLCRGGTDNVSSQQCTTFCFDGTNRLETSRVDSVGFVDMTGGVTKGEGDGTILQQLFSYSHGHLSGSQNQTSFAGKCIAAILEHLTRKVDDAEAWSLVEGLISTTQKGLSTTVKLVTDSFVLAKQIPHFLLSNTHPHPGMINIRANILGKFCHVGLAEALHFTLRLVEGIKVGATNGCTYIKSREGVGKDGIKAQCLDSARIDMGAKVEWPFVGTQTRRILNSKSTIHANNADIIQVTDTEL
mmetsp:Transcript_36793/g.54808  ORF Transcript_36793/g.54808 Transcript_36793/m.54808 type:complete len:325 (+) Transcript_36793:314-1288(+)